MESIIFAVTTKRGVRRRSSRSATFVPKFLSRKFLCEQQSHQHGVWKMAEPTRSVAAGASARTDSDDIDPFHEDTHRGVVLPAVPGAMLRDECGASVEVLKDASVALPALPPVLPPHHSS